MPSGQETDRACSTPPSPQGGCLLRLSVWNNIYWGNWFWIKMMLLSDDVVLTAWAECCVNDRRWTVHCCLFQPCQGNQHSAAADKFRWCFRHGFTGTTCIMCITVTLTVYTVMKFLGLVIRIKWLKNIKYLSSHCKLRWPMWYQFFHISKSKFIFIIVYLMTLP